MPALALFLIAMGDLVVSGGEIADGVDAIDARLAVVIDGDRLIVVAFIPEISRELIVMRQRGASIRERRRTSPTVRPGVMARPSVPSTTDHG